MLSSGMTHTVREKHKLLARVRRIRGQVEAIERALDGEAGCERRQQVAQPPVHFRRQNGASSNVAGRRSILGVRDPRAVA